MPGAALGPMRHTILRCRSCNDLPLRSISKNPMIVYTTNVMKVSQPCATKSVCLITHWVRFAQGVADVKATSDIPEKKLLKQCVQSGAYDRPVDVSITTFVHILGPVLAVADTESNLEYSRRTPQQ